MELGDLLDGQSDAVVRGDIGARVSELTDDSRLVTQGACFVARRGRDSDGGRFVDEAVRRGAKAVVSALGPPAGVAAGVVWVRLPEVDQRVCGALAERFFDEPSRKLRLIGITGTNGKTTTAFLVQHLLNQAGVKCGLIGSVWNDLGGVRVDSDLTTPGAIEFSRLLSRMVDAGCGAAVAEVSSHGLKQGRISSLNLFGAVFTNITGDHLDYHRTLDDYAGAKAKLFSGLRFGVPAIVNVADPYARFVVSRSRAKVRWSLVEGDGDARVSDADYIARVVGSGADHSVVRMSGNWGLFTVRLPLVGRFNVSNALQAAGIVSEMGVEGDVIEAGLACAPGVPGRVEAVRGEGAGNGLPVVVVDYAHTHDALANVLGALRPVTRGRLTVVFGCGGDRDTTKRSKMGEVAGRLADRVVVTSDNPRTEEPGRIIEQILEGIGHGAEVSVEQDRGLAIEKAIGEAGPGDTVLLAGKGHEGYQIVGDQKLAFDDRERAAAALSRFGVGS